MSTARVALATCAEFRSGDEDAATLLAAFDRAGVEASWQVWDDPAVDWSAFDATLIRSTWDYTTRRDEFLAWTASVPRLVNPAPLVAWSSDKVYLADLAAAGVPVVPTRFLPPGAAVDLPAGDVVLKPSVGAGSRGAGRFTLPSATAAARAHVAALHADGRTVLLQEYVTGVDTEGETAVVCLGGVPSHAARKAALLAPGTAFSLAERSRDGREELYVQEVMAAATPTPAQDVVARQALALLADRFGAAPAYARVDLLPSAAGPVVVELELVEPSLFLAYATGPAAAADRLVAAVVDG